MDRIEFIKKLINMQIKENFILIKKLKFLFDCYPFLYDLDSSITISLTENKLGLTYKAREEIYYHISATESGTEFFREGSIITEDEFFDYIVRHIKEFPIFKEDN